MQLLQLSSLYQKENALAKTKVFARASTLSYLPNAKSHPERAATTICFSNVCADTVTQEGLFQIFFMFSSLPFGILF